MSELQIGLIALGVVMIGIVLGLNWWQDRRVRRKMQENFPPSREDPLLGGKQAVSPAAGAPARKARSENVEMERREPAWDGSADESSYGSPAGPHEPELPVRAEPVAKTRDPGSRVDDPE